MKSPPPPGVATAELYASVQPARLTNRGSRCRALLGLRGVAWSLPNRGAPFPQRPGFETETKSTGWSSGSVDIVVVVVVRACSSGPRRKPPREGASRRRSAPVSLTCADKSPDDARTVFDGRARQVRESLGLNAADSPPEFGGYRWQIVNEDLLAMAVARLVVGQYRYVERILHALTVEARAPSEQVLANKAERIRGPSSDKEREHRDGWIMQMLSWIAAHVGGVQANSISPPHVKPTFKGFDSVALALGDRGEVTGLVVTEDKATKNARKTVRDKVWPEIRKLEAGELDDEIEHSATAVVERYLSSEQEIAAALASVFWKTETRSYRVCIASHDFEDTSSGRAALFKGYSGVAGGLVDRRKAETLHTPPEVRGWMDAFCEKVANGLEDLRQADV